MADEEKLLKSDYWDADGNRHRAGDPIPEDYKPGSKADEKPAVENEPFATDDQMIERAKELKEAEDKANEELAARRNAVLEAEKQAKEAAEAEAAKLAEERAAFEAEKQAIKDERTALENEKQAVAAAGNKAAPDDKKSSASKAGE